MLGVDGQRSGRGGAPPVLLSGLSKSAEIKQDQTANRDLLTHDCSQINQSNERKQVGY